ncbi:MAG: GGDEF domain-containing protein [Fimbriimonadales bacterium]|nr:GGDEF domain-containing protein [Fimbriimonadales bacterium]
MRAFWKPTTPSAGEDPARLAHVALPALTLALEALEGAANLTVSPGTAEAAEFRRRLLAYGSELARQELSAGRIDKIREAIGPELEAFGDLQRSQVEEFVREVRDSIRGIVATLRSAMDPADDLAHRMERMQRHLAFASECDDLAELRRVVREQASAAKEALLRFTEDRHNAQEQFASTVGVLEEKLERVELASQTDHLTQLANRAALDYYLEAILQKARLGPAPYSLAVADVDDLAAVNRDLGESAGDQALNALAGRLKAFLGSQGFLCRLGGDEFVVVGPWTPQGLKRRLDDLARHLLKSRIVVQCGRGSKALSLSISAGVTPIGRDDSRESVLSRAQRALEESKQGGKGRTGIRFPQAA